MPTCPLFQSAEASERSRFYEVRGILRIPPVDVSHALSISLCLNALFSSQAKLGGVIFKIFGYS